MNANIINNCELIAKVPTSGKKPLMKWASTYAYGECPTLYNSDGVAYITGAKSSLPSGEVLYALDFDVKNGVGNSVITSFIELIPKDLEAKLHKHSTPSGGLHILFFGTSREVLRCSVLARTASTTQHPRGIPTIELKGEGGIINVPPSLEYNTINGYEAINALSEEEVQLLLNAAKACNYYIPANRDTHKRIKNEGEYWELSPIDAYNASNDIATIIEGEGWQFLSQQGAVRHYAHPNKRERATSATLHTNKRLFYVFSTSTNFPEGKAMTAFALFAHLRHGGDMKAAYNAIKDNYGTRKPYLSRVKANKAAVAGRLMVEVDDPKVIEAKPPQPFWVEKNGIPSKINHSQFMQVLCSMGFCRYNDTLRRKQGNILLACDLPDVRAAVEQLYGGGDSMVPTLANSAIHSYWASTFYPDLPNVEKPEIVMDNKFEAFLFFKNNLLRTTKDGSKLMLYDDTAFKDKFFLSEKIIPFDYKPTPNGFVSKGEDFVEKAIIGGNESKKTYTKQVIGYLSHAWKSSSTSYIVVAPEPNENPEDGGGAGKDMLFKLINLSTKGFQISAENFRDGKVDDTIYQPMVGGESIVNITDFPRNADLSQYKSLASEDVTINVKYKNRKIIASEDAPKIYISTNYSVQCVDGGVKRRLKYLEFTGFFNDRSGNTVRSYYGGEFPEKIGHIMNSAYIWTYEDYCGFYEFLCECRVGWLTLVSINKDIVCAELSLGGALKQLRNLNENAYSIAQYLYEDRLQWLLGEGWVSNSMITSVIDGYIAEEGIKTKPSAARINEVLKKYFAAKGIEVLDQPKKVDGRTQRGKTFVQQQPPPTPPPPIPPTPTPPPKPTPKQYPIIVERIISDFIGSTPVSITERWLSSEVSRVFPNFLFDFNDFFKWFKKEGILPNATATELIADKPSVTGRIIFLEKK